MGKKRQQKLIKPPELPPEKAEEEVDVSDEDLDFITQNSAYAAFVSELDTTSIDKYVSRIADAKEDEVEALYEKRLRKQKREGEKKENEDEKEVDPVDALPVKTLDGELYYRRLPKKLEEEGEGGRNENVAAGDDKSVVRLTKPERRAKLKREKKEAKKQQKQLGSTEEEVQQTPQASVLVFISERNDKF